MSDSDVGIYAYLGVFVALVAAGLGFPIPEEIPVVTGGSWCARAASHPPPVPADWAVAALGLPVPNVVSVASALATADLEFQAAKPVPRRHPLWWFMLPVCILGVVISDGFLYTIGRYGGTHLLETGWVRRHLVKPEKRAQIERNFQKYGIKILLGARLLPGIRAPIFVMAGVMRLPLHRFLLADGLYAIPGVTLLFTLAYWFTDQVVEAVYNFERRIGSLKPYMIIAGIAAIGCFLLYEYLKRSVVTGDPHEVPLIGEKVIKPPPPPVDRDGSALVAPVAEQQAEVQAQRAAKKK